MSNREKKKRIKCVVWDLDNTVWDGILMEDNNISLKGHIRETIRTLDKWGILQSISSRNDHDLAMAKLEELGLAEYFLYPQIGWNTKSSSIKLIAEKLNIGMDSLAFIDDQTYEREEVSFELPEILTIDGTDTESLLEMEALTPVFITDESARRRTMYMSEMKRNEEEISFQGPRQDFLESLKMKMTIHPADEEDLKRVEELTLRTNQLNSTGCTYTHDELDRFRIRDDYMLYIVELEDRFGSYGKVGVVLVEVRDEAWNIKLFLMSCRVMNRGVGSVVFSFLKKESNSAGKKLQVDFIDTGRNRMMYMSLKFADFKEISTVGERTILEADNQDTEPYLGYMEVITNV